MDINIASNDLSTSRSTFLTSVPFVCSTSLEAPRSSLTTRSRKGMLSSGSRRRKPLWDRVPLIILRSFSKSYIGLGGTNDGSNEPPQ
jgi:hypothetical protein